MSLVLSAITVGSSVSVVVTGVSQELLSVVTDIERAMLLRFRTAVAPDISTQTVTFRNCLGKNVLFILFSFEFSFFFFFYCSLLLICNCIS